MANTPGDLASTALQLQRATRALQEAWAETRLEWHDSTAADFERIYLEPLLPQLRLVLAAVAEMDELFHQATRDLES